METIPRALFPGVYVPLIALTRSRLQETVIREKLESGAGVASAWSITGFSLSGLVLTLLAFIPPSLLIPPFGFSGQRLQFGQDGSHVVYCDEKIPPEAAGKVAQFFLSEGYFEAGSPGVVELKLKGERCVVSMPVFRTYWTDSETLGWLAGVRIEIEGFVDRETHIILVDEDLRRTYRKEL